MKETEPVTKYMATKLITFQADQDIWQAMKIILKNKISGGPVLDEDGDLIGMLSEKDCLHVLIDGPYNDEPQSSGTVGDFMSKTVTVISAEKTIVDAAYTFTTTPIRRLPVVDNGKVVGQISRRDILTAILKIKPKINIIPDSWRGREPMLHPSRRGFNTKNT